MRFSEMGAVPSPAGHGPTLGDGVAPQIEPHTNDGARQEDCEYDQWADQQVEKGIEDWAAGRREQKTCDVSITNIFLRFNDMLVLFFCHL